MSEEKVEQVEQPLGVRPMTAEERKQYGLPPLKEETNNVGTKSNT